MEAVELFDQKRQAVVASLGNATDEKSILDWLVARGLTLQDGEVMDMRTLPFEKTDLVLRQKEEAIVAAPARNPLLEKLKEQLEEYLTSKRAASETRGLIDVMVAGFMEAAVRGVIDDCRKNGVAEGDILSVLGENVALAQGGTRVEMVFTSR